MLADTTRAPMTAPPPLRTQARAAVGRARDRAVESGALPAAARGDDAPAVEIERPAEPGARRPGQQSGDEARPTVPDGAARDRRGAQGGARPPKSRPTPPPRPILAVDVAPPGFLNLRLADPALEAVDRRGAGRARRLGPRRSRLRTRRVNVEFVSANPTGPLTIGNARGAFVGDLLCRVLEAGGQEVTREYYFNDSGGQVDNLGASVLAVRRGRADPGGRLPRRLRRRSSPPSSRTTCWADATEPTVPNAADAVGRWAGARVRAGIEASLERLGVHFDVWTTEDVAPRGRLGRAGDRAAARAAATSSSRTARCGSARPTSATTRTG